MHSISIILTKQLNIENEKKKKRENLSAPSVGISVTESSEENLDPNLAGLRRSHLDILNDERLVRFISHSSFTITITTADISYE